MISYLPNNQHPVCLSVCDGATSLTEYREFLIRQTQIPLSVLDSNKDGEVSAEELNSMAGILQSIDEILVLSLFVERHADGFRCNCYSDKTRLQSLVHVSAHRRNWLRVNPRANGETDAGTPAIGGSMAPAPLMSFV